MKKLISTFLCGLLGLLLASCATNGSLPNADQVQIYVVAGKEVIAEIDPEKAEKVRPWANAINLILSAAKEAKAAETAPTE